MRYFTVLIVAVFTAISFQASASCFADFNISQRGSTFTFYDSSYTVNGRSITWDFGDGNTSTGSIVTHTYNTLDTFEVCLVIEDTVNNCSDTICKYVSNIQAGGGSSGCNLGMLFSPTATDKYKYSFVNISSGASSYRWLFPHGDTSTAQRPIYDFDTAGTYKVCLVGYDTAGNSCDTICMTVTIQGSSGNSCNARFTYTTQGLVNRFNSNTSGRPVLWTFGDGDTSNLFSPIHTYDSTGTYTVCLVVYDSTVNGLIACDSSCQTITLGGGFGGNNCSAGFTYSADSSNFKKIHFSNTSIGPRYLWKFGDGNTDTTRNPIHSYDSAGSYVVCLYVLTAYDSLGLPVICDSICNTVNVGLSCDARFTYSLDSVISNRVHFSGASAPSGGWVRWHIRDGGFLTFYSTENASHTFNSSVFPLAEYYIYNADSTLCDSSHQTINISIKNCQASFYIGLDTSSKYNIYIVNNSTGANSSTSYLWTFGDGDSSTQKNPTHQYASFGLYNLCLTITTRSATGTCTSTYCDSIGMDSSGMLLKNGAFGITVIDEEDLVSTPELDAITDLRVYPNPSKGQVTVSLNALKTSDLNIQIVSMMGQEVMRYETKVYTGSNNLDINLSEFVDGLYFVKMNTGQESKVVRVLLDK